MTALPASLPSPRGLDFLRYAYSKFFMRVQIGHLDYVQDSFGLIGMVCS
jgi:hypothetical protein